MGKISNKKCEPGCTCRIHTNSGSRPCLPGCTCWKHDPEGRKRRGLVLKNRPAPERQTCAACGLSWDGWSAKARVVSHPCLGSASPSLDQFLQWLNVFEDDHGCLIPAANVKRARGGTMHWLVPYSAVRLLGDQYPHRIVLRMKLGRDIEPGHLAAHECGPEYENDRCVNPDHIHERTKRDNSMWIPAERRKRPNLTAILQKPEEIERRAASNRARWASYTEEERAVRVAKVTAGRKKGQ